MCHRISELLRLQEPLDKGLFQKLLSTKVRRSPRHSEDKQDEACLYANKFHDFKAQVREDLKKLKANNGRIAVFGAGHTSAIFINIMEIQDLVEFVVDDNPNKHSLYMPGSALQIKPSESLVAKRIDYCLLTQNPESEKVVVKRNKEFVNGGGIFGSISPQSRNFFANITRSEF